MRESKLRENVHKWLIQVINDPIVEILTKNSNLTKTQLETLLIDVLAENITDKSLNFEKKAKLRLLRGGVSRGAFNRTLKQARRNVIKAIYTILLLGYLGFFGNTRLDPYIEIANKLHKYTSIYRNLMENKEMMREHIRVIEMLHKELEASLEQLSKPRALRKT